MHADLPVLKRVVEQAGMEAALEQVSVYTAYVLAYELLMGQGQGGIQRKGPAEKAVLKHKEQLRAALKAMLDEAGAKVRACTAPPKTLGFRPPAPSSPRSTLDPQPSTAEARGAPGL